MSGVVVSAVLRQADATAAHLTTIYPSDPTNKTKSAPFSLNQVDFEKSSPGVVAVDRPFRGDFILYLINVDFITLTLIHIEKWCRFSAESPVVEVSPVQGSIVCVEPVVGVVVVREKTVQVPLL